MIYCKYKEMVFSGGENFPPEVHAKNYRVHESTDVEYLLVSQYPHLFSRSAFPESDRVNVVYAPGPASPPTWEAGIPIEDTETSIDETEGSNGGIS